MARNPIDWFEIYVQDLERARDFYQAVFQIELQPLESPGELEMLAFPQDLDQYGCGGALVAHRDMPSGGNSTVVYLHCDDCAEEAARVGENGGTLLREKMSIGQHGFVALAKDPDGNLIGLHSNR